MNNQRSILSFFNTIKKQDLVHSDVATITDEEPPRRKHSRLSRKRPRPNGEADHILAGKLKSVDTRDPCAAAESDSDVVFIEEIATKNTNEETVKKSSLNDSPVFHNNINSGEPNEVTEPKNDEEPVSHSFYYYNNFLHVMNSVLSDDSNSHLFNEADREVIRNFQSLSEKAQKLYIRLFQRKLKWIRESKINYPEICHKQSPSDILDELVSASLVHSVKDLLDVSEATDLLFEPELKQIAKKLNFAPTVKGKGKIIAAIQQHCQQHKSTSSLFNHKLSLQDKLLKTLKETIQKCYKIKSEPRRVFIRLLMLFSLPTLAEDENDASGGQQQQFLTLLWTNQGKLKFPDYKIVKTNPVFKNRESFIAFETAKQIENEILGFIEAKDFENALNSFLAAKTLFQSLTSTCDEENVPDFLQKFTASHVYVRCLSLGVEILQRLKDYKSAVELLETLLDQKFCPTYRGKWWNRLALNYDQHLKNPEKALEVVRQGISDENVKIGHYLDLHNRGEKLIKSLRKKEEKRKKIKRHFELEELPKFNITEAPKVVIRGKLFPQNIPGHKTFFIAKNVEECSNDEETALMSVEELAIHHYKQNGYAEGLHGEGSTFISLFGLLFWDILYEINVPDVFQSPYQASPLDLNCLSFYQNRKESIDEKLNFIEIAESQLLADIIKDVWEKNISTTSLVSWDRFSGVNQLLGLLKCISSPILRKICQRFAEDFRHYRSGFPDLVVWNTETQKFKVVEVKGPGDRLSPKQIIWMHFLLDIGVETEVCYVEAGAKKLKRN